VKGIAALDEGIILFFRKAREALRAGRVRTVACEECLGACMVKRAKFEKMLFNYRMGGLLFAFLLLGGSAAMGGFAVSLLIPSIAGALFICVLPYFYYCPAFAQGSGKKA
jgi:hypothetical protein